MYPHSVCLATVAFTRYYYYLHYDTALAESVAALQPTWRAGTIKKVLSGLTFRRSSCYGSNSRDEEVTTRESSEAWLEDDLVNDAVDFFPPETFLAKTRITTQKQHSMDTRQMLRRSRCASKGSGLDPGQYSPSAVEEEGEKGEENKRRDRVQMGHLSRPLHLPSEAYSKQSREASSVSIGVATPRGGVETTLVAPATKTLQDVAVCSQKEKRRSAAVEGDTSDTFELPEKWKDGVEGCLKEASKEFQRSIRRSILNYVLLDPGQQERLGALFLSA